MTFNIQGGPLGKEYLTEAQVLEDYVGNTLWTWGYNFAGELGDNTIVSKSSPVQTIAGGTNWKQVSCGGQHTAAIKTDGTLWLWGQNGNSQLGDGTVTKRSSPVQTVSGGTNWKQVSVSEYHTAAIKTDGTLWAWGGNTYGQIGDNTTFNRSSPVQTISGGTNWKHVRCGASNTVAIKTDGTLWAWGGNTYGQIGDNTTTPKSSPVQTISGGTNWKHVSCGGSGGAGTVCAIKTDGTLWLWGYNSNGQLGDNTTIDKLSPVQTVATGTNWKQMSNGRLHTAAIKTDGTLWLWGNGGWGNLGDNTTINRLSPVQTISGGTNWKQVSCGNNYTAAIKTDGTLWCWGYNVDGGLGDNTTITKSSPVQTISQGTNWKQVSASYSNGYTTAITFSDLQ